MGQKNITKSSSKPCLNCIEIGYTNSVSPFQSSCFFVVKIPIYHGMPIFQNSCCNCDKSFTLAVNIPDVTLLLSRSLGTTVMKTCRVKKKKEKRNEKEKKRSLIPLTTLYSDLCCVWIQNWNELWQVKCQIEEESSSKECDWSRLPLKFHFFQVEVKINVVAAWSIQLEHQGRKLQTDMLLFTVLLKFWS